MCHAQFVMLVKDSKHDRQGTYILEKIYIYICIYRLGNK